MKFYDCTTAPSPRRVRIFAAEKGIELDTVQIDLMRGEQFSDEYRAINPDCVVPALVLDDGTCLTEAMAICQYLEHLHPEPALFGSEPVEQAVITMWNIKIEQQGLMAMAEAFRNSVKGLANHAVQGPHEFAQIPELAVRGKRRVELFFEKLNERLDGREFVASDAYSVADITALVVIDFAKRAKIEAPAELESLHRWYAAVSARPSASA